MEAVLESARAVAPGQGQSVRVAGVKIGDIGDVELEDGRAVVELEIEQRFKGLVREDSTALLRPKTGLKDMFIELDPGHGAPMDEGDADRDRQHRARRGPRRGARPCSTTTAATTSSC